MGRYPEVVKYPNSQDPVALYLPECWLSPTGRNTLAVFDEEGQSPSRVRLQIERIASREVIAVSEPVHPNTSIALPATTPSICDNRADSTSPRTSWRPLLPAIRGGPRATSMMGMVKRLGRPTSIPTAKNKAWVQIDLGQLRVVEGSEFEVWQYQGALYSFYVEGSADGTTWTMLVDRRRSLKDKADFKPDGCLILPLKNAKKVRYVRLTIVHVLEPQLDRIGIGEFRVWGEGLH